MRGNRTLFIRIATALADSLRRFLVRRSDRTWIRLLQVARLFSPYAIQKRQLGELAEILEDGGPGSAILRRAVADTSREELRDIVWSIRVLKPLDPTQEGE